MNLVCAGDVDAVQIDKKPGLIDSLSLFNTFYYPSNTYNEGFWVSEQSVFMLIK